MFRTEEVLKRPQTFVSYHSLAVHTFCHAIPKTWYQMGVILSATDSLNWLSSVTGKCPMKLSEGLTHKINGPSSEKFYPYLAGERTMFGDLVERNLYNILQDHFKERDESIVVFHGIDILKMNLDRPFRVSEKDFVIISATYQYVMVIEVKKTLGAGQSVEKSNLQLLEAKRSTVVNTPTQVQHTHKRYRARGRGWWSPRLGVWNLCF